MRRACVLACSMSVPACGPLTDAFGGGDDGEGSSTTSSEGGVGTGSGPTADTSADSESGSCATVHEGDLEVSGTVDANYSCLIGVTGFLRIRDTDLVDLTPFAALEVVGSAVLIEDNPQLASLNGLQSLRQMAKLEVIGNPALVSVEGLAPQITMIAARGPTYAALRFRNNVALADVDGLWSIDDILVEEIVEVELDWNQNLVDVNGLAALVHLGPALHVRIQRSPLLASLGGAWGAESLAGLSLYDLLSLQDLSALAGVREIAVLEIAAASTLQSLAGLESLERAPQRFFIGSCASGGNELLVDLDLPMLQDTGEVRISDNDSLTSLAGLSTLVKTGHVQVVDNVSLATADAEAWAMALPEHGEIEICGNGGEEQCSLCPPRD